MTAAPGVLLPTDEVALYRPGVLDGHGWRLPGEAAPYWTGAGNLQLAPGVADVRGLDAGHGPHGPARDLTGLLFLPADAEPADGATARVRGRAYVLSQCRVVLDPAAPGGGLTCWTATATSYDTWPDGGAPRDG